MRYSAARALNLIVEEYDQSGVPLEAQAGMISADGGLDPYVGTAYDVPVKVGRILIPTSFRLVRKLRRPVLLGVPWASTARLTIEFNTMGRATCRIRSMDGKRLVSFLGLDPAPTKTTPEGNDN